jgi:hypothetical protein
VPGSAKAYRCSTPTFHFYPTDYVHQAYQIIASKVKMLSPSSDPLDESILQIPRQDELPDIVDEADKFWSDSSDSTEEVNKTLGGSSKNAGDSTTRRHKE